MKRKQIFVCWSGGADSTYLIQRCIEDDEYELVLGGYVVVDNNADKAGAELMAIEKMLPLLNEGGKFAYLGALARIHLVKSNPNLAFKQMPIWLFALVAALHPPVDEVAIGYHRGHGDDASAHLDDLRAIYAAYRPLFHHEPPALVFPLANVTKKELLSLLRPELRARCVHCEYPVLADGGYRACGKCRLCVNRAADEAR